MPQNSTARRFFGEVTPEAGKRINTDIAERRGRPTTEEANRDANRRRVMSQPVKRPDVSTYDTLFRPRGVARACAGCERHVESGANCPGRDPASDNELRGLVPDCHSLHDADRAAVRAALDRTVTGSR
jgi:hypothetical protein